jgi:hypothetical protein
MEHVGDVPMAQLVEAIAAMGLMVAHVTEAIDHNTDTQQDMVNGLAEICEAITRLTHTLANK